MYMRSELDLIKTKITLFNLFQNNHLLKFPDIPLTSFFNLGSSDVSIHEESTCVTSGRCLSMLTANPTWSTIYLWIMYLKVNYQQKGHAGLFFKFVNIGYSQVKYQITTYLVPWIIFLMYAFTDSNPKQEYAHNGPKRFTTVPRWRSKCIFIVCVLSPVLEE